MSSSSDWALPLAMLVFYGIFIVIALIGTVFWIIELVDVARREFADPNTKIIWVLIIVFLHGIGALIYYFVGKPQGTLPGQGPHNYPPRSQNDSWPPPPGAY